MFGLLLLLFQMAIVTIFYSLMRHDLDVFNENKDEVFNHFKVFHKWVTHLISENIIRVIMEENVS